MENYNIVRYRLQKLWFIKWSLLRKWFHVPNLDKNVVNFAIQVRTRESGIILHEAQENTATNILFFAVVFYCLTKHLLACNLTFIELRLMNLFYKTWLKQLMKLRTNFEQTNEFTHFKFMSPLCDSDSRPIKDLSPMLLFYKMCLSTGGNDKSMTNHSS